MAVNKNAELIQQRRALVADLVLAGMTQREIVRALEQLHTQTGQAGAVNPETSKAWDVGTINKDIKAIKAEWRVSAIAKIDEHIATQYARLEKLIQSLWGNRKHPRNAEVILQALKRQADLFGLDKPLRADIRIAPDQAEILQKHGLTASAAWEMLIQELAHDADDRK